MYPYMYQDFLVCYLKNLDFIRIKYTQAFQFLSSKIIRLFSKLIKTAEPYLPI